MSHNNIDQVHMMHALNLAKKAADLGEVPVGAVIVKDGAMIGEGWNLRETSQNPLDHAEMVAIRNAAQSSGAWRLSGSVLYVTLEPCLMCAGAIYQARITRVVIGAMDPKAGACGSLYCVHEDTRLNHRYLVETGLLADESSQILKDFFRQRRASKTTT
ncbi:MAG: tRNA adenosine(34) deaminase TadA [Proteobacteria bacterium]|nr:tRNA adenosine(34) deaminase TadA [Pseudomonadota bacterium]